MQDAYDNLLDNYLMINVKWEKKQETKEDEFFLWSTCVCIIKCMIVAALFVWII